MLRTGNRRPAPLRSDRHVKERLVACQCPEVEYHRYLLSGIGAHHEGPELLRQIRHRGGKTAYWKMLHAEQLIDQQTDEDLVPVQHQHPPLLARSTAGGPEELAEVDDRQESATHIGHTPGPGLDPGQCGVARLMENFTDLAETGDHGLAGEAETDATPGFGHHFLRRQAGGHPYTTLRQLPAKIERMQCL